MDKSRTCEEAARPSAGISSQGQDTQNLSGRTLPNAPDVSLALNPTVTLPLGQELGLQWSLDASYRGQQYSATDLDEHSYQAGHWLIGTRLVLSPVEQHWRMILSASNLFDRKGLDLVVDHAVYDNSYIDQQIPGRSVGLSLLVNF